MKKFFTILMSLTLLVFTQCKPTPEGGDGENEAGKSTGAFSMPQCGKHRPAVPFGWCLKIEVGAVLVKMT